MAYLTCPDCMMPNPVGDDAVKYACFTCFAEIIFETCPGVRVPAGGPLSVARRLRCGHCSQRVEIPRQRFFATSTRAKQVEGFGYMYPRM